MRQPNRHGKTAALLTSLAGLALLLSSCLGANLPKCNSPEALEVLEEVLHNNFNDLIRSNPLAYGMADARNYRVEGVRTIIELFHQNDPPIRGCSAIVTSSAHLNDLGAMFMGRPRDANGRVTYSESAEYTIEWQDRSRQYFWLQLHSLH